MNEFSVSFNDDQTHQASKCQGPFKLHEFCLLFMSTHCFSSFVLVEFILSRFRTQIVISNVLHLCLIVFPFPVYLSSIPHSQFGYFCLFSGHSLIKLSEPFFCLQVCSVSPFQFNTWHLALMYKPTTNLFINLFRLKTKVNFAACPHHWLSALNIQQPSSH